jgi:hypothetical protein
MAAGPAVDRVAVAQPNRAGVAGLAGQRALGRLPLLGGTRWRADDRLELGALLGVGATTARRCWLRAILDCLAISAPRENSTWRRITGSYLRSRSRSGSLRRFLRVT